MLRSLNLASGFSHAVSSVHPLFSPLKGHRKGQHCQLLPIARLAQHMPSLYLSFF